MKKPRKKKPKKRHRKRLKKPERKSLNKIAGLFLMYKFAGKNVLPVFLLVILTFSARGQITSDGEKPLTLAGAVELAMKQASNYRSAQISERIAVEDIKQAKV